MKKSIGQRINDLGIGTVSDIPNSAVDGYNVQQDNADVSKSMAEILKKAAETYATASLGQKVALLGLLKDDVEAARNRHMAEIETADKILGIHPINIKGREDAPAEGHGVPLTQSEKMKAYWAARRAGKGSSAGGSATAPKKKRRTMSPEARAKIAAAQKLRWAKVNKAKK